MKDFSRLACPSPLTGSHVHCKSGSVNLQFDEHLCNNSHSFNSHGMSCGPWVIVKLRVLTAHLQLIVWSMLFLYDVFYVWWLLWLLVFTVSAAGLISFTVLFYCIFLTTVILLYIFYADSVCDSQCYSFFCVALHDFLWSICLVCQPVCWLHPWALQKWLNQLRCHLGCRLDWTQGTIFQMGVQIYHGKRQFWGFPLHWKAFWL